jgi:hypothetical protein
MGPFCILVRTVAGSPHHKARREFDRSPERIGPAIAPDSHLSSFIATEKRAQPHKRPLRRSLANWDQYSLVQQLQEAAPKSFFQGAG